MLDEIDIKIWVIKVLNFFKYNWQVRDEWFDWCKQLPIEELLKERTGGVGSILGTLFHIAEVEYSWVRAIQGEEDLVYEFTDYHTLEKVKSLSDQLQNEVAEFLSKNSAGVNEKVVNVPWDEEKNTVADILHHIIAHEIHHMGQLSVWARQLGLKPVSASFIGREFRALKLSIQLT